MIEIREVNDQQSWDVVAGSTLLQQWKWGEFQLRYGKKVWRLGAYENDTLLAVALVTLVRSKLRSHLYISNGPVIAGTTLYQEDAANVAKLTQQFLHYIKKKIATLDTHFVRIDPLVVNTDENIKEFKKIGVRLSSTYVQPEKTILIDLTQSEEEILAGMSTTTRYGVKKGAKDGITVTKSTNEQDFDVFWKMYEETVKEKQFVSYSKKYYKTQFDTFKDSGNYAVYLAKEGDTPLVASLIAYDTKSAYYLHTGRRYVESKASKHASKVLVWEAIKDAKALGKESFNLYGIAKNDNSLLDPWAGLTEFKKGFGGQIIEYVGAFDYPLTPNYWFIRILEKTRRIWGYPYFLLKQILRK